MLGVPRLERLHDPRHLGRDQVHPLPLRHGERPPVRPADHHDRDADHVEAGDHADPRDPDAREERQEPIERLARARPCGASRRGAASPLPASGVATAVGRAAGSGPAFRLGRSAGDGPDPSGIGMNAAASDPASGVGMWAASDARRAMHRERGQARHVGGHVGPGLRAARARSTRRTPRDRSAG